MEILSVTIADEMAKVLYRLPLLSTDDSFVLSVRAPMGATVEEIVQGAQAQLREKLNFILGALD